MGHECQLRQGTERPARRQDFDDLEPATEVPLQSMLDDDRLQPSPFQAQYVPVGATSLLGALAIAAIEALNASTGVNELLLAGEERVALVTKLENLLTRTG